MGAIHHGEKQVRPKTYESRDVFESSQPWRKFVSLGTGGVLI
jgi:hypothetical protein